MAKRKPRQNCFARITLRGWVPSKKNTWRYSKHGVYVDSKTRQAIDWLTLQVNHQWGFPPLEAAEIVATVYHSNNRQDLDNMYTTVQDVLVKRKVLASDSTRVVKRVTLVSEKCPKGGEGADLDITGWYYEEAGVA